MEIVELIESVALYVFHAKKLTSIALSKIIDPPGKL